MKYAEQKGLISIIIPIYNNEINLIECLNSVLMQTFTNWEAILVNDGSTDNTGKVVDEYAKKDSRFVAIHKQNEGTLLARKTGLENSKGEFIANLDHDDIYNPEFLEKMHAKITETDADFVWSQWRYATDYEWSAKASDNVAVMFLLKGPSAVTWNKLIKRRIYIKVKFCNIKIISGEDPIQMAQIAYYSKSASFVSENLYFHRSRGASSYSRPMHLIQAIAIINEVLEMLFNGLIPINVKNVFYYSLDRLNIAYQFLLLEQKERKEFNKLKPFLPKLFRIWLKNRNKNKFKNNYKRYERIYIYGTGILSERTIDLFNRENIAIEGFIVSDGHKTTDIFKNKPVYELSSIKLNDTEAIVLALSYEHKIEVVPFLKNAKIHYFEN